MRHLEKSLHRLELRRRVMERWSQFVILPPSDNVVELRKAEA
jgi:hypothetical protein